MNKFKEVTAVLQRNMVVNEEESDGGVLDVKSNDIFIESVKDITESAYIKPKRITYIEKGVKKIWDVVEAYDSVSVIVYNTTISKFLLVKMFRPAVWNSGGNGFVLDLCAGLVDKDLPLIDIAREEVLEELGYKVENKNIELIGSTRMSVGLLGTTNTMYFVNISFDNRVSDGGGVDNENIEVVSMSLDELRDTNMEMTMGVKFLAEKFG